MWLFGGVVVAWFAWPLIKRNLIEPVRTEKYVQKLRVNIPSVRFKGDNVTFDMFIQNPNNDPMTIRAIVGDVYVSSNKGKTNLKLGNIDRYGATVIKPTAETKFTFSVRLKFINLVAYFNNI